VTSAEARFDDDGTAGADSPPPSNEATEQRLLVRGPWRPDLDGWAVQVARVPVAVVCADPRWHGDAGRLLHRLAGSIGWGVRQVVDDWDDLHTGTNIAGYRIRLVGGRHTSDEPSPADTTDETAPRLPTAPGVCLASVHSDTHVPGGVVVDVTLSVDVEQLSRTAHHDAGVAHGQLGQVLAAAAVEAGIDPTRAQAFVGRWSAQPPTLAVQLGRPHTSRTDLPYPWRLDATLGSQVNLDLAKRVRDRGIAPALYRGDEAKRLDNDVLAPAAFTLLTERLARHHVEDVIVTGMEQLGRVLAARDRTARDIERAKQMNLTWDPAERLQQTDLDHLLLRQCGEIVVEAALRESPTGDQRIDELAWMELIAAARGYLEATSRSEAVHNQVRPTAIDITDMFEIKLTTPSAETLASGSRRVYNLDLEALRLARAAHRLRADPTAQATDSDVTGSLIPAGVDEAMQAAFGAGATDLTVVLAALAMWPMAPDDPDVAITSIEDAVNFVLDSTVISDEPDGADRVRAAIDLLTSTPSTLRAADWRPWQARTRRHRLLVQPLVSLRPDFLVIAPHYCTATMGTYWNYMSQGMLPWSKPEPPNPLRRALADLRDRRSRALERSVAETLKAAGYSVIERILPEDSQRRLGVPSLTGEIDIVAGHPDSPVVWLLEVKDPADAFVVSEIRRALDRFYVGRTGERAYIELLGAKNQDLQPYADAVAGALNLPAPYPGRPRMIKPMFVTRLPAPAAFVAGPIPFATEAAVVDVLKRHEETDVR